MSRRDQITLTPDEIAAFLGEQRVVIVATNGPDGWPHLMPLWFVVRDGELWGWTYGRSQKVKNLERDARATLQIETGEQYQELRGVMIKAEVVVHHDLEIVSTLGAEILQRYSGGAKLPPEALDGIRAQAVKRVGLQFVPQHTASWDHGKLGGTY
jgi:general stress protein 26